MRPGEARHYGTIQQPTETATGTGGQTMAWSDLYDAWAKIEPIRGREYWDGQTIAVEHWVRITVWYNPEYTVTEGMSFLHNSTRYLFQSVANVGMRNESLEIMAIERA